jgi:hypothetical protein
MILEGLVTTLSPEGQVNLAPMGPDLAPDADPAALSGFVLRPFRTARTYANLVSHPEGVLHVSDDVLLLARAALGAFESGEPLPLLRPAERVRGRVLADACRWYEFRIVQRDDRADRVTMRAEVVAWGRGSREWFGFNRAKHAVLEAAILATRTAFLPPDEIEAEYRKLAVLVAKTGGPREQEAFGLLQHHLAKVRSSVQGK